jgi:hypothetical protein
LTWAIAVVFTIFFIVLFVAYVAFRPMIEAAMARMTPAELMDGIIKQSGYELLVVAGLLALMPYLSKLNLRELGFRVPTWRVVGASVLAAIAMTIVGDGLASLFASLAHTTHEQGVVAGFKQLHDPNQIAIFASFAVIFAPVAEETIFRIFFFNLGLRFGGFWVGSILSGVLFGLAHTDLLAAIPLALGGMILCYVYYRTRNAFAPMMTHAMFNGFSVALLLFGPKSLQ